LETLYGLWTPLILLVLLGATRDGSATAVVKELRFIVYPCLGVSQFPSPFLLLCVGCVCECVLAVGNRHSANLRLF
jgi:hypothetical protein